MSDDVEGPPRPHRTAIVLPDWDGYERHITSRGAYEQRSKDPSKDYGISGVRLAFRLIAPGKKQAITWELLTTDFLPATRERMQNGPLARYMFSTPGAVDFHYSEEPEEGCLGSTEACELLPGTCYYDTGFSMGDAVYEAWAYGGFDGVFGKLRELLEND